jgi:hypothetical protein
MEKKLDGILFNFSIFLLKKREKSSKLYQKLLETSSLTGNKNFPASVEREGQPSGVKMSTLIRFIEKIGRGKKADS